MVRLVYIYIKCACTKAEGCRNFRYHRENIRYMYIKLERQLNIKQGKQKK